jgi:hypothetical protein
MVGEVATLPFKTTPFGFVKLTEEIEQEIEMVVPNVIYRSYEEVSCLKNDIVLPRLLPRPQCGQTLSDHRISEIETEKLDTSLWWLKLPWHHLRRYPRAGEVFELPAKNLAVVLAKSAIEIEEAIAEMNTLPELKIDTDIQFLCKPLDNEAHSLLEKGITERGCIDPIIYWEGKNIIVDGHNRFEICNRIGKPFNCVPMNFESKEDVMNWVIDHQLGRRNLSEMDKSYLRGKRYLTEKKAAHRPGASKLHQNDGVIGETAQKIAKKTRVSQATIERDALLAEAIDKIRNDAGEDFGNDLRSGKVKLSKKGTIALSKKPTGDLKAIAEQIVKGAKLSEAEMIVQSQMDSSSNPSTDATTLPDPDKELKKFQLHIDQILTILDKVESTTQPHKLSELSWTVLEIYDRLKEIEENTSGRTLNDNVSAIEEIPYEVKRWEYVEVRNRYLSGCSSEEIQYELGMSQEKVDEIINNVIEVIKRIYYAGFYPDETDLVIGVYEEIKPINDLIEDLIEKGELPPHPKSYEENVEEMEDLID